MCSNLSSSNVRPSQDLKDDIDTHREPFKQLKILSYKITDVCMQEDVAYIDVTVTELEARWKELLDLSLGRRKDLDENYKLSQKFFKGAEELMKMLDEAEQGLKDEEPIGVDPAHLRAQLKKHKVGINGLSSLSHVRSTAQITCVRFTDM